MTVQLALASALEKTNGDKRSSRDSHLDGRANWRRRSRASLPLERDCAILERRRSRAAHAERFAAIRSHQSLAGKGPALGWEHVLTEARLRSRIDYFRELQQRFPNGNRASYAHWKAAWLTFRQSRIPQALQAFEDQIALYPDSSEIPAALYWRARVAEEQNNPAMARAFYQKLSDRFHNYYYAELARQRLKTLAPHRGRYAPGPASDSCRQGRRHSTGHLQARHVQRGSTCARRDKRRRKRRPAERSGKRCRSKKRRSNLLRALGSRFVALFQRKSHRERTAG